MENTKILAVNKVIKKAAIDNAREGLTAGQYTVDFLVRIQGLLTIGEDYEQHIVAKAEPWLILAVALSKLNNVTLENLVEEAYSGEIDVEEIKQRAQEALEVIKAPTLTICKGKVTTKLDYAEVTL
jgi:hypothetical protein